MRRPQTADKPRRFSAGFCFEDGGAEGVQRYSGQYGPGSQGESDLLDVLCGGGEQALAGDGEEASKAGVAVAVELLGVGERTFDGLLAALVDTLAPRGEPMSIGTLAGAGPNMAND